MRISIVLLLFLLTGCSGGKTTSSGSDNAQSLRAGSISCTAAYRADVSQPIEREETITFEDVNGEQTIAFADMSLHVGYDTGEMDNERALRLWVTDAGDTTIYQRQLYQLSQDSGPDNQFKGGHGFTGLNYVYHPDSSSELQFWCQAE
ncbi:MAG: hypothetical protein ACK2T3_00515 [Candidatus Promineifilaceae bacterium]